MCVCVWVCVGVGGVSHMVNQQSTFPLYHVY